MFKEYNSMKQSDEIKSTEYDISGNNIIFRYLSNIIFRCFILEKWWWMGNSYI